MVEEELQKEVKEQVLEKEIEEPIVEKEIPKEDINGETEINHEIEHKMEDIRRRPYVAIRECFEARYPYWGSRVWSLIALIIISLIMPKIVRGEKLIKNRMAGIIFGSPGIGKTQTAEDFAKVAYNCLFYENITPARFYNDIINMDKDNDEIPKISLACSDLAVPLNNEELVKLFEQVLGEDNSISRANMKNKNQDARTKVDVVSYLSGTCDLMKNQKISRGLMFRALTLIVLYTKEEHEKILEHVNGKMGIEKKSKDFEHVIRFYRELWDIQHGRNSKISKVTGYEISDEIRREIGDFIKPVVEKAFDRYSITFVRTLEETYRCMCAHAMLNIYNRRITNGKIKIEMEDCDLAKKIIQRDIAHKVRILQTIEAMDIWGINDLTDLRNWTERMKDAGKSVSEDTTLLMKGIIDEQNRKKGKRKHL